MSNLIIGIFLIAFLATIGLACSTQAIASIPATPLGPAAVPPANKVINVDDLMKNPEQYTGLIKVAGVVSAVYPEQQALTLIDTREFSQCGVVTCATLTLPVHWSGAMPGAQDIVQAVGEIKELNKKLIFVAQALEKAQQ